MKNTEYKNDSFSWECECGTLFKAHIGTRLGLMLEP